MSRTGVQWLAISFPALLVGGFEYFRHGWLDRQFPGHSGNLVAALLVAAGVSVFVKYFVGVMVGIEQDLGRARAEAAVLAERQRIGREMHDSVAQTLFHLRIRLQDLDQGAAQANASQFQREMALLQGEVAAAYDQVRAVIADLKRQAEGEEEASEALRRGVMQTAERLGLDVKPSISEIPHLDAKGRQHLLAIVSEAMSNAKRHGQVTSVTVTADGKRLIVTDQGHGFDPRRVKSDGFGLMIMEERARMLGGDLKVESEPGKGTRIILRWEAIGYAHSTSHR